MNSPANHLALPFVLCLIADGYSTVQDAEVSDDGAIEAEINEALELMVKSTSVAENSRATQAIKKWKSRAVPFLERAYDSSDGGAKLIVLEALAALKGKGSNAIPFLKEVVRNRENGFTIRYYALGAFLDICPDADCHTSFLVDAFGELNPLELAGYATVVQKSDAAWLGAALVKMAETNPSPATIELLGEYGPKVRVAAKPLLMRYSRYSEEPGIRLSALNSLLVIDGDSNDVRRRLKGALYDDDEKVQKWAREALRNLDK